MKLINVVGARPNFMKIAPLMSALGSIGGIDQFLVHTGQHYDSTMSDLFFSELGIPRPDVNLGVGSGSQAVQTAAIMTAFEPVLIAQAPDAVLVVGDVNSTIACGMVAVKLGVKLIHVEAGLRSFDRTMPEEINRILTDSISDLLFCSERSGVENLRSEGVPDDKVFLVGNVMIDTLLRNKAKADESLILDKLHLASGEYAVLTLHRPANVDDPAVLGRILDALETIASYQPIVFPVHPRTRNSIEATDLTDRVARIPNLRLIDPIGYLDFLKLMSSARVVLTDSGGIQEETTILHVPCLTLRENTERPITLEMGTSHLVGSDPELIVDAYHQALGAETHLAEAPPLWDGRAAARIAAIVQEQFATVSV